MGMSSLTTEQRKAIESIGRPTTLMAAAGSGKTTVLVERYLRLLDKGYQPKQILTVTFTNEAADQIRRRIIHRLTHNEQASQELISQVEASPYIGTIHSFCYRLLDHYGSTIGCGGVKSILSSYELSDQFERAFDQWIESLPESTLNWFLELFSRSDLKTVVKSVYHQRFQLRGRPEVEEPLTSLLLHTEPLVNRLENVFYQKGAYSFDDLENLAIKILETSSEVRTRLQSEIQEICVDEFQDTSRLQWQILQSIIGANYAKLFVVGDPKQSIYGFRNADVNQFLSVANSLTAHAGVRLELTTNFRSQPKLLEAINQIAEHLLEGASIPFQSMSSGIPSSEKKNGLFFHRFPCAQKTEIVKTEKRALVSAIKENLALGVPVQEMAVLFRNSDRLADYFATLSEEAIPSACRQRNHLFDAYDIADIANFIRTLNNPLDDFFFSAFLRSRFMAFSSEQIAELFALPGSTLFEKSAALPSLRWFMGLIESGALEVSVALATLFRNSRYFPVEKEALFSLLGPLSEPGLTIPRAVTLLRHWEGADIIFQSARTSGGHHGIQLMTVHAAKGLEFPHVFLVDNLRQMPHQSPPLRCHPDYSPGIRYRAGGEVLMTSSYEILNEQQAGKDLEESRRILYVALTRAKETLTVFLPENPDLCPKDTWGRWLNDFQST